MSGLNQQFTKLSSWKRLREFESHILRMNDNLFYVAQKAFIKKDNKVLILIKHGDKVDFPGGKIQESETDLMESFKRETMEETGLSVKINKPFYTWHFTLPESHKTLVERFLLLVIIVITLTVI